MSKLSHTVESETPDLLWLYNFDGVNLRDDRRAINDQECSWLENFIPLGPGNARAIYDNATAIYTASQDIVYDFAFNLGAAFYHALFLSDGSAIQVAVSNGAAVTIAAAATFTITPTLPACAQVGAQGIVIVTSNNYYAWDGTLYSAGGVAPGWLLGLSGGAASVQLSGHTHSNTTIDNFTDLITGAPSVLGIVVGMSIRDFVGNTDIPANTTVLTVNASTYTITISNSALLTTSVRLGFEYLMPSGVNGNAVESYMGRIWIMSGNKYLFSSPQNGADFSTAGGGGTVVSSDAFLKTTYMNLKQSNGFLYMFGDGSISVISNVQTSGTPTSTTFSYQNVDRQTGLGWRDAIVPFGNSLCFANPTGVYQLYGGSAQKVSDKIDALFQNAVYTSVTPTMFLTVIFNVVCIGIILNTLDPTTSTQRTLMAVWNGDKWFIASQTLTGVYANWFEIGASPQGWANDKRHVYRLFQTASATLPKKIVSKLWAGRSMLIDKTSVNVYAEVSDFSGLGVALSGSLDSDMNSPVTISIPTSPSGVVGQTVNAAGRRLGVTITTTSKDFTMIGFGATYNEETFYG
jgi:hypothetical protein